MDNSEKNKIDKVAFTNKIDKSKFINAGKSTVEKAAEGLGRTIFPAAVSAITGRNLMNSLKSIEEERQQSIQEDMANKIVINVNQGSKKSIKRQVSKQIDELINSDNLKTAEDNSLIETLRDGTELMENKKKIQGKKVHIGNGMKKQFKMDSMHGVNPMHPQG